MANPLDAVTKSLNVTSASEQLQSLKAINDNLLAESLRAMQSSQQSSQAGGGGDGGSILGAFGGALAGGLGLSSLISGVADLFGGGGSTPSAPTPYVQPLPIQLDAGFSAGGGGASFATDSAEGNLPRTMTGGASNGGTSGGSGSGSSSPGSSGSGSQITVQVQALDSQSFLDRSQDIAMAVRQAMLESTVLNDVIRGV
jgi:hypothetical protein